MYYRLPTTDYLLPTLFQSYFKLLQAYPNHYQTHKAEYSNFFEHGSDAEPFNHDALDC